MNPQPMPVERCRNEGCPRAAEPGESYCPACGLERALFRRDVRRECSDNRAVAEESPVRR